MYEVLITTNTGQTQSRTYLNVETAAAAMGFALTSGNVFEAVLVERTARGFSPEVLMLLRPSDMVSAEAYENACNFGAYAS